MKNVFKKTISFIFLILCVTTVAKATDLSSQSFIVRDPVIGSGGEYQSSGSFKLYGSGNFDNIGSGSSATYNGRFGFLYYPYVNVGTLAATPNGLSINLSWASSAGGLGYNVSGYKTGIASATGGPYTYTSVGNVTMYSYTSLEPGTYYFVVQTLDEFGNVVGISNEAISTVIQSISFSVNTNAVGFGSLTNATSRYATGDGAGSSGTIAAHTLAVATNATNGYSVTYSGPQFSTASHSISGATITADIDGTPGTEQFALSASTDGGPTIPSAYQYTSQNWNYIPNTQTTIAYKTSVALSTESIYAYYLANIAPTTTAGLYNTVLTYTTTANF